MSSTAPQIRSRLPRIAEVAVRRARLTVVPRPRTRPQAPRVPFVTLVTVILLAGVIGLLLFNTSMQQASFRATTLEQQAADLTAQEEALRIELQQLHDPQRIAELAQRRGMVVPTGASCVLSLDGGVTGTCVPAPPGNKLPMDPPDPKRPASLDPEPVTVSADRADGRNGARNGVPDLDRRR